MLRYSSSSKHVLLRCLQHPFTRKTATTPRACPSLGQASSVPTQRNLATAFPASAGKKSSPSPIYPESKASERRNPHAPQLFQHFRRWDARQDASPAADAKQRVSSDSYILRNVSTDMELKQLYTALGKASDCRDAVQVTKLCQLIKERKLQLSATPGKVTFEPEEKIVFLSIMRALAYHGLLEEIQAINSDMLNFGFEECIDSLNHLLQAAVVSADEAAASEILDRIFALNPSAYSGHDSSQELAKILLSHNSPKSPQSNAGLTLPVERMRNWNAATFAHMVDSSCQEHNLEYALLLLSTCYRMGMTLPHESLARILNLCLHCEESRAAVELADLIEEGGLVYRHSTDTDLGESPKETTDLLRSEARSGQVARRFAPSIWMSILRSCAESGYLPGVELAWSRAVTQGLLSPDDGLILSILSVAAKEGSVQMARTCLQHINPSFEVGESVSPPTQATSDSDARSSPRRLSPASKRMEIQEWHLSPFFEAQCSAHDYEGAFSTLRSYYHRGFRITDRTTSRISTSIYPDRASLDLARAALVRSATDAASGTHIAIVNAVLAAAVWLGDLAQALEIYHSLSTFHRFPGASTSNPRRPHDNMVPNIDTFNTLLSGCIDASDYEVGTSLLSDLNALYMRPSSVTFERMIMLCLTQRSYEDAFGFVEEAKERKIVPSRKSYEALVRKCFTEKDHRWQRVLADMNDHGYRPSRKLMHFLELDSDSFDSP